MALLALFASCGKLFDKVFLGGGGRPGDGDEGVPGYIAKLRGIHLTVVPSGIAVTADPGTVVAPGGSPDALKVRGFFVSTADLDTIIDADTDRISLSQASVAAFTPTADGGFSGTLPGNPGGSGIVLFNVLTEAQHASAPAAEARVPALAAVLPSTAYRMISLDSDPFVPIFRNAYGQAEYSSPALLSDGVATRNPVVMGADDQGNLFVVYAKETATLDLQPYVSRRRPNGAWDAPLALGGPRTDLPTPSLAVSPEGHAILVFSGNVEPDVYQYDGTSWSEAQISYPQCENVKGVSTAARGNHIGFAFVCHKSNSTVQSQAVHVYDRVELGAWMQFVAVPEFETYTRGQTRLAFHENDLTVVYAGLRSSGNTGYLYSRARVLGTWQSMISVEGPSLLDSFDAATDQAGNVLFVWAQETSPRVFSRYLDASSGTLTPTVDLGEGERPHLGLNAHGTTGLLTFSRRMLDSTHLVARTYSEKDWVAGETILFSWSGTPFAYFSTVFESRAGNALALLTNELSELEAGAVRFVVGRGWGFVDTSGAFDSKVETTVGTFRGLTEASIAVQTQDEKLFVIDVEAP